MMSGMATSRTPSPIHVWSEPFNEETMGLLSAEHIDEIMTFSPTLPSKPSAGKATMSPSLDWQSIQKSLQMSPSQSRMISSPKQKDWMEPSACISTELGSEIFLQKYTAGARRTERPTGLVIPDPTRSLFLHFSSSAETPKPPLQQRSAAKFYGGDLDDEFLELLQSKQILPSPPETPPILPPPQPKDHLDGKEFETKETPTNDDENVRCPTQQAEEWTTAEQAILIPRDSDILCGSRSKHNMMQPGNIVYQEWIRKYGEMLARYEISNSDTSCSPSHKVRPHDSFKRFQRLPHPSGPVSLPLLFFPSMIWLES